MNGIVHWLTRELRSLRSAETQRATDDYMTFDRVDGRTLDYREFRRSASLCGHPSLVTDFAETEASCTYSWAPVELSTKS